jgi:hypothetical protein
VPTIYVYLPDEGVAVWSSVEAESLGDAFRIVAEGSPRFFVAREFPLRAVRCGVHEDAAIGYESAAPWS